MARKPDPAPATRRRRRGRPSRRIAAIGLVGTGLYATGLPVVADAQAPVAVASPAATSTPTPEAPAATPTPAPAPPAATPVQTPTPESPTPVPTPTPAPPEATPTAEGTTAPAAAAPEPAPAVPGPARSRKRPTPPDADESVDRAPRRNRRPNVKTGKSRLPRNPAPAGREHAPGRPADRPTPPDSAPVPAAGSVPLAAPVAAPLAPTPISVPGFLIDQFRIPPFLLPIYQAAGVQYGVQWEILAAINEIETDYGRNLNLSSAGATGWMQFMPATWADYGVDANGDGHKDPYNPVDAIFAAARYLRAAGAGRDIREALFAYNHADWYVDSVLRRARLIGGLPSDLVGSLTGLAQGRFPVRAKARDAASTHGQGVEIIAPAGAPVIAVNDGRIVRI